MRKSSRFPRFTEDQIRQLIFRRPDIGGGVGRKIDWHHAILTKRDVMGLPDEERAKINNPINILIVDSNAHLNRHVPTHQEALPYVLRAKSYDGKFLYTREDVLAWWRSIKWNSSPPFVLDVEKIGE